LSPTLDEIAALTNVSRATVSRAINGGPIADATRRRIMSVLEQTNYRPNTAARSLAMGHSGVVGVAMHIDSHLLFQDPYFAQLLQGISDVLCEHEAAMMLWVGNRTKEDTLQHILRRGILDGVIVTANQQEDPLVDGLLASSIPTVIVGHRNSDPTASYVDIDNAHAADVVTSHMIKTGRRRIGHVTGSRGTSAAEDRLAGYERAMRRAGLATDGLVVDGDFNKPSGVTGAAILMDAGVDAIFCANDAEASGALETIRGRGLCVPEDIALAGFDDLEFSAHLEPPLTTIRQGVRQQGSEAANVLFELLRDPAGGSRRVLLPTELVIRQSTVGGVQRG